MPVNVSVKGVPEAVVEKLRQRAKRNHRSLQGEMMAILEEAAGSPLFSIDEAETRLSALKFKTGNESMLWVRDLRETKLQYTIIIRKAPDGLYIAGCPLIPEAHAQGESYEECLANIKEVLELCIEYRKERNEEIPDEVGTNRIAV